MGEPATDKDLMGRFTGQGDRAAYEELVRRWDSRLFSFLAKASGDLDAAEDLRQEVFVRLYRYGKSYNPRFAFSTWIFRIASNALSTWQSRRSREEARIVPSHNGSHLLDRAPNPRECVARMESDDRIRGAIADLDVEDRELLLLRFEQGLSYREIAESRETPESTVKSRVYAILGRLKRRLSPLELKERI